MKQKLASAATSDSAYEAIHSVTDPAVFLLHIGFLVENGRAATAPR